MMTMITTKITKTKQKKHKDFPGEFITINGLEREIAYYKTLIREHDTGHIHTCISFLQERVNHLKGECAPG